jgi:site-specific DNA-methyltransferase (adenine-specific)
MSEERTKLTASPCSLFCGDCLELMREIPDNSVDMVCADLPYGTTQCKWDSVIPLDALWVEYKRVCKPSAAIVLTACQPFTTSLISSNIKMFKYCWVWEKERLTNIAQVKKRAGKTVEDIVVFYAKQCTYNPQMVKHNGPKRTNKIKNGRMGVMVDASQKLVKEYKDNGYRYPTQVLKFQRDILTSNLHPTQKPVALMEYLIRTYTNEGETVLDNTMGSGTAGVAALNEGRNFIGIERDADFFRVASERIYSANK